MEPGAVTPGWQAFVVVVFCMTATIHTRIAIQKHRLGVSFTTDVLWIAGFGWVAATSFVSQGWLAIPAMVLLAGSIASRCQRRRSAATASE